MNTRPLLLCWIRHHDRSHTFARWEWLVRWMKWRRTIGWWVACFADGFRGLVFLKSGEILCLRFQICRMRSYLDAWARTVVFSTSDVETERVIARAVFPLLGGRYWKGSGGFLGWPLFSETDRTGARSTAGGGLEKRGKLSRDGRMEGFHSTWRLQVVVLSMLRHPKRRLNHQYWQHAYCRRWRTLCELVPNDQRSSRWIHSR